MPNSQALANRDYAIRQGVMRNLYGEYGEGTGSVIVEEQSASFRSVPRVWEMLISATPYSRESLSATSGVYIVITKNQVVHQEALVSMENNLEAAQQPVVLSPASVLDIVRTVFGLNISETAEVFGITRQTAYQWMKLTDMEQVRSHENRDRIKQLYGAAQSWQTLPPLKGRWLHSLLPTGNTVLDLLKASPVDLDALQAAYQTLFASTPDRRREEGERTTQAVTALAGAFAGLGAGRKSRKGAS
ncbi:MAG: helix-turn-helix domain containing protein [Gammaproteobacteria bacterium]|nr:helix-turn-helix domain containing protein [Gammaproteobacteria bacterium]MCW8839888.1 helix-turn-helix domain containing protein [Gammaproteobacteria bacterium]MCW8958930.1 helix-turn-helix domain containing protein [Gammaproteobacteria bacterium]MCW8992396.1 helix-turn-helix domain containing protein [Gammaproteobacteria bacterium]